MAMAERLAEADPNNAGWQRDLSISYERALSPKVAPPASLISISLSGQPSLCDNAA